MIFSDKLLYRADATGVLLTAKQRPLNNSVVVMRAVRRFFGERIALVIALVRIARRLFLHRQLAVKQLFHLLPSISRSFRIIAGAMVTEKSVVSSIVAKHTMLDFIFF